MTATTDHNTDTAGAPLRAGERLRQARLRQGLTLARIGESTRIAPRHLAAIEEADYGKLPADPYTRGYLRAYAGLLDMDADEVAVAFFRERGGRPARERDLADPELAVPVHDSPATGALCILAAIVLVVGVFCAVTGWNPLSATLSGMSRTAPAEQLAYHPAPPETLVEINAKAINLEAHFLKDTEVRLQLDGAGERRAVYVKESKATWEANSTIRIEFAKPYSAELRVNGRPLGFPTPSNGQYLLSLRAKPGAS